MGLDSQMFYSRIREDKKDQNTRHGHNHGPTFWPTCSGFLLGICLLLLFLLQRSARPVTKDRFQEAIFKTDFGI